MIMNKAVKKVSKFIENNVNREREKYMIGLNNNLFEWEDLQNEFNCFLNNSNKAIFETLIATDYMAKLDRALKILKENNLMHKFEN